MRSLIPAAVAALLLWVDGASAQFLFPLSAIDVEGGVWAVATADVNGDGRDDLVAASGDGTITVLLGTRAGFFALGGSYPADDSCHDVVAADLDGDGDLDVATVDSGFGGNSLAVLMNDGDGAFGAPVEYEGFSDPEAIAAADLDLDGDIDLVVAGVNRAYVVHNDGAGAFTIAQTIVVTVNEVVIVDVDGDGWPDAVGAGSSNHVLLNNQRGTFTTPVSFPAGGLCIAAGDVDGDEDHDLAIGRQWPQANVTILHNHSGGLYGLPSLFPTIGTPTAVALAPLQGDAGLDMVASMLHAVWIWRHDGSGGYLPPTEHPTSWFPDGLGIADPDADGDLDVLVVNRVSSTLGFMRNRGDGNFARIGVSPNLIEIPLSFAIADMDGDGRRNDIVVGSSFDESVVVHLNNGDGTLEPHAYEVGGATRVAVGDVNGDGATDVVAALVASGMVSVLLNDGHGVMKESGRYPVIGGPLRGIALGDFDGRDGLDVVVTSWSPPGVAILLNDGDGVLEKPIVHDDEEDGYAVEVADVDGDGAADVLVLHDAALAVFKGNGDGTLQEPLEYGALQTASDLTVADFDGDGDVDVAVANLGACIEVHQECEDGFVSVMLNPGDGAFTSQVDVPNPGIDEEIYRIAAGDLDGDGDLDLCVSAIFSSAVQVLVNDGRGHFAHEGDYVAGGFGLGIGDLDGDNDLDVVTAQRHELWILSNSTRGCLGDTNGDATIDGNDLTRVLLDWNTSGAEHLGDTNGDGLVDVDDLVVVLVSWGPCS